MTTKEVASICGVTDRTVSGNAQKAGVVLENGKSHNWTEEEVKRLQLVLMANAQNNNVNASEQVKDASKTVFELGTKLQPHYTGSRVVTGIEVCTLDKKGMDAMGGWKKTSLGLLHEGLWNAGSFREFEEMVGKTILST